MEKVTKQNKQKITKRKQRGAALFTDPCYLGPRLIQHYPICWYTSMLHALFLSKGMNTVMEMKKQEEEKYYTRTILRHDLFKALFEYRKIMEQEGTSESYKQYQEFSKEISKACISIPKQLKMSCQRIPDKSTWSREKTVNPCLLAMKFSHDYNVEPIKYGPGFSIRVAEYKDLTLPRTNDEIIYDGALIGEHVIQIMSWLGFEHEKDFMYYVVRNYKDEHYEQAQEFMEEVIAYDIADNNPNKAKDIVNNMKFIAITAKGMDADKEPLPQVISLHGQKFILDSAVLSNSAAKRENAWHAIAGITCPWIKLVGNYRNSNSGWSDDWDYEEEDGTKYVINSWEMSKNIQFDWANKSFVMRQNYEPYGPGHGTEMYGLEEKDKSKYLNDDKGDYHVFDVNSDRLAFYVNSNFVNINNGNSNTNTNTNTNVSNLNSSNGSSNNGLSGGKKTDAKEYIKYNGNRYLIRYGQRGSKYISTKTGKVYLSVINKKQSKSK